MCILLNHHIRYLPIIYAAVRGIEGYRTVKVLSGFQLRIIEAYNVIVFFLSIIKSRLLFDDVIV